MLRYSLPGYFAAFVLLGQAPAFGQSAREWNTSSVQSAAEPSAGSPDFQQVRQLIFTEANVFRSREKRPALQINKKLAEAADYFAHYLARTDKFSHTADGNEPWDRATEHGYRYCIVLENIAFEFNSEGFTAHGLADAFIQGWEQSPGHRRNLLDPDVSDTGVGVARSSHTGRYYAVQMFGRPRSQRIVFEITNETEQTISFRLDKHAERIRPGYTMTYTRCRPPEVDLQPVNKSAVFHPASGAHLVLVPKGESYQVRQE